jgi:hypothetical protein
MRQLEVTVVVEPLGETGPEVLEFCGESCDDSYVIEELIWISLVHRLHQILIGGGTDSHQGLFEVLHLAERQRAVVDNNLTVRDSPRGRRSKP